MEHEIDVISRTVHKTDEWLRRVALEADLEDRQHAYQVLRAVLHALRDRVSPDVAAHVAAQLPLLVRGIYYEGWVPAKTPMRLSLEQFLGRVEKEAGLKGTSAAEQGARAVLSVCWDELGEGTMSHLISVLPDDFALLL